MRMRFCIVCMLCIGIFSLMLTSCDDDGSSATGQFSLEITDSPVDRADVQGAFVTIAEVKLDGRTWSGFDGPQTIDLMAYHSGSTKILGNSELEAKSYSNVELVLDLAQDASGNSPGCYVLTSDQVKHDLAASGASEQRIVIEDSDFTLMGDEAKEIVVDFDLRKCIADNTSGGSEFRFVSDAEMNGGLRTVAANATGRIEGNCDDAIMTSDRIVVYAYAKGSFDRNTELQGQGASQIMFANAETSAVVDGQGNYTLAFLENGDYELVYASYSQDSDDSVELNGTLMLNTLLNLDLQSITVQSNTSVTVDVLVTGILPL